MKAIITLLLCLSVAACLSPKTENSTVETKTSNTETVKKKFREGTNYRRVEPPVKTQSAPGMVEVVEMFLYGCPHCYELEPRLNEWVKKHRNVSYKKMPAILGPGWAEQAKFYYTAKKLGKLDELHNVFFDSIHKDGQQYYSELSLRKFFTTHGVNVGDYENAYLSKEVLEEVNYARKMSVKYNMRGVPFVVVNGKHITAPFLVSSQEEMLEVLDYLVAKEAVGNNR